MAVSDQERDLFELFERLIWAVLNKDIKDLLDVFCNGALIVYVGGGAKHAVQLNLPDVAGHQLGEVLANFDVLGSNERVLRDVDIVIAWDLGDIGALAPATLFLRHLEFQ